MKTLTVTFENKEYKIRDNWATKRIFQEAIKENPDIMNHNEDIIVFYAYAALLGYNENFDMEFDKFTMAVDDESNKSLLDGVVELLTDRIKDAEKQESTPQENENEKK